MMSTTASKPPKNNKEKDCHTGFFRWQSFFIPKEFYCSRKRTTLCSRCRRRGVYTDSMLLGNADIKPSAFGLGILNMRREWVS